MAMGRQATEPPDLSTISGRLRYAREAYVTPDGGKLTSSRAAAKFFGWPENTYKAHERGERQAAGMKTENAERYARAFGVSIEWLALGRGQPFVRSEPKQARRL